MAKAATSKETKALSNDNTKGIAAAIASTPSICDKPICIDSDCSCHLMADVTHFDPKTIARTTEMVTAIGRQKILLTQKGTAKITTADGVLTVTNTYYAKGLEFGLISVPQLVQRGVSVYLTKEHAYLEKNSTKIHLREGDLWALPMKQSSKIAALMTKTNAETWNKRLGHMNNAKTRQLVKEKMVPALAADYDADQCATCSAIKPMRRPVPNVTRRSGETVVQVDYMPMGQDKRGWKGEVGTYVYSCRASKILKVYTVKNATAEEAADTLKDYLVSVRPYLKKNITCIQTYAAASSPQKTG